jgi:hypothetical protein
MRPSLMILGLLYGGFWCLIGAWQFVVLLQPETRRTFATINQQKAQDRPVSPMAEYEAVRTRLEVPAALLASTSAMGLYWTVLLTTLQVLFWTFAPPRYTPPTLNMAGQIVWIVVSAATSLFIIVASDWVRSPASFVTAVVVAVAAISPCSGCMMWTAPLGLWVLAEITRPQTRALFGRKKPVVGDDHQSLGLD